jgi:hypothetical protein
MSRPEQLPAIAPPHPLEILAVMAAILMAGDLSSGAGCCEPEFYAARALELYLAAQERLEPKLRGKPAQGNRETP